MRKTLITKSKKQHWYNQTSFAILTYSDSTCHVQMTYKAQPGPAIYMVMPGGRVDFGAIIILGHFLGS